MSVARAGEITPYGVMRLSDKIRVWRETARLSQEELAERAGVAQSTLGRWETGTGEPKLTQAAALARALGVSLDFLADDSLDAPPNPSGAISEADQIILELAKAWGPKLAARRLQYPLEPARAVDPPETPPGAR